MSNNAHFFKNGRYLAYEWHRRWRAPLTEPSWTNEIEPPYRTGVGRTLHLLPGLSIVVGRWRARDEEEFDVDIEAEKALAAPPERIREWVGA